MTDFKYCIKNSKGEILRNFSEHTGADNAKPLEFRSIDEAERYAKDSSMTGYIVVRIVNE